MKRTNRGIKKMNRPELIKKIHKRIKKEIKLIGSDFDGTIIHDDATKYGSSWEIILNNYLQDGEITKLADHYLQLLNKEKNISKREEIYEEWVREDTLKLKGLDAFKFMNPDFPIPYMSGAELFFRSLNGNHYKSIISGGINILVERVAQELGFDDHVSTILHVDENNKFTGAYTLSLKLHGKLGYLERLMEKLSAQQQTQIGYEQVCYIGDGVNDIDIAKKVYQNEGITIIMNPKIEELKKYATIVVNDFTELMIN